MNIVIIVCIILFTISVIVATVFFVITMVQILNTTKKADKILSEVDNDIETIRSFYQSVVTVGNLIPSKTLQVLLNIIPKFKGLVCKKNKNSEEHNG